MATSILPLSDPVPFNIFALKSMPPSDKYRGAVVEVRVCILLGTISKSIIVHYY